MEMLTIRAASPESGHALLAALSGFRAELLESAEGCEVVGRLDRNYSEIVAVLNALAEHVNDRADGPARVELSGRTYLMHPDADST